MCAACKRPIAKRNVDDGAAVAADDDDEAGIAALDKTWHTKCFVCVTCKTPLRHGFVRVKGAPWCAACRAHAKSKDKAEKGKA